MIKHLKKLSAVALALAIGLSAISPVSARDRDGEVAAGVVGGLALGTILGGTLAAPPPQREYYAAPPRRVYVPADEEFCGYHRVRIYDEDGEFAGYRRVPNRC